MLLYNKIIVSCDNCINAKQLKIFLYFCSDDTIYYVNKKIKTIKQNNVKISTIRYTSYRDSIYPSIKAITDKHRLIKLTRR